jgi:hypothetical protein
MRGGGIAGVSATKQKIIGVAHINNKHRILGTMTPCPHGQTRTYGRLLKKSLERKRSPNGAHLIWGAATGQPQTCCQHLALEFPVSIFRFRELL